MQEKLQLGLDKVRINKNDLLTKLRANLEKHQAEWKEAHDAWRVQVIETMENNLEAAKAGEEIKLEIDLDEPQDHSGSYRKVISMLTASVDEILVIAAYEFQQYHDDEWSWKQDHNTRLSTYSKR